MYVETTIAGQRVFKFSESEIKSLESTLFLLSRARDILDDELGDSAAETDVAIAERAIGEILGSNSITL